MLCASDVRYVIIGRYKIAVLLWDAYRLLLCFVSKDFGIVKRWHEGDDWYDLIVFKRKWILDKLYTYFVQNEDISSCVVYLVTKWNMKDEFLICLTDYMIFAENMLLQFRLQIMSQHFAVILFEFRFIECLYKYGVCVDKAYWLM